MVVLKRPLNEINTKICLMMDNYVLLFMTCITIMMLYFFVHFYCISDVFWAEV